MLGSAFKTYCTVSADNDLCVPELPSHSTEVKAFIVHAARMVILGNEVTEWR